MPRPIWRRPKALRSRFDDQEDELWFEFFLAEKLNRTVGELRDSMTDAEFGAWMLWYAIKRQKQEQAELEAKAGMNG